MNSLDTLLCAIDNITKIIPARIKGQAHVRCRGHNTREFRPRWFGGGTVNRTMLRLEPAGRRPGGREERRFEDMTQASWCERRRFRGQVWMEAGDWL